MRITSCSLNIVLTVIFNIIKTILFTHSLLLLLENHKLRVNIVPDTIFGPIVVPASSDNL